MTDDVLLCPPCNAEDRTNRPHGLRPYRLRANAPDGCPVLSAAQSWPGLLLIVERWARLGFTDMEAERA